MDELENLRQSKQALLALNFNASVQQGMPKVLSPQVEHVLRVDAKPDECVIRHPDNGIGMHLFPKQKYGDDLESGLKTNESDGNSFLTSAKKSLGKAWIRFMPGSITPRVNGLVGEHTGTKTIQYGFPYDCQGIKEARLGFVFNQKMAMESAFCGNANQSQPLAVKGDMDMTKSVNPVSGCSDKTRVGNGNSSLKPSWKKPPRPPKATTDPSRERHIKGISDIALLRRAKLERMKSLRKNKFAKSSSDNTSFWALLVTLSFCVIMIMQGIFSQSTGSPQNSSSASAQASSLSVHSFAASATNSEPGQAGGMVQLLAPLSYSGPVKEEFRAVQSD